MAEDGGPILCRKKSKYGLAKTINTDTLEYKFNQEQQQHKDYKKKF
jgi:hypothetical protein